MVGIPTRLGNNMTNYINIMLKPKTFKCLKLNAFSSVDVVFRDIRLWFVDMESFGITFTDVYIKDTGIKQSLEINYQRRYFDTEKVDTSVCNIKIRDLGIDQYLVAEDDAISVYSSAEFNQKYVTVNF